MNDQIKNSPQESKLPHYFLAVAVTLAALFVIRADAPDPAVKPTTSMQESEEAQEQSITVGVASRTALDRIAFPNGIVIELSRRKTRWHAEIRINISADKGTSTATLLAYFPPNVQYVAPDAGEMSDPSALRIVLKPGDGLTITPLTSRLADVRLQIDPRRFPPVQLPGDHPADPPQHLGELITALEWEAGPTIRKLGLGRDLVSLTYSQVPDDPQEYLDPSFEGQFYGIPAIGEHAWTPPRHLARYKDLVENSRPQLSIVLALPDVDNRFVHLSPTPDQASSFTRTWNVPNQIDELHIEAVVQDDGIRGWVDLARNSVFLLLGAVLGWLPSWRRRGIMSKAGTRVRAGVKAAWDFSVARGRPVSTRVQSKLAEARAKGALSVHWGWVGGGALLATIASIILMSLAASLLPRTDAWFFVWLVGAGVGFAAGAWVASSPRAGDARLLQGLIAALIAQIPAALVLGLVFFSDELSVTDQLIAAAEIMLIVVVFSGVPAAWIGAQRPPHSRSSRQQQ